MTSLTMTQGLQIALYGFLTVFLMLSVLMVVVIILGKVVGMMEKTDIEEIVDDTVEEVIDLPKEYTGEIQLIDVDEKTAVCIMAIISEETQIPLENLIFKRIQLIKEEN